MSGHLLKLGARTRIALLQDAVETYSSDLAVSALIKRGCKLHVPCLPSAFLPRWYSHQPFPLLALIKLMTLGRRKPSDAYSQLARDSPSWWIKAVDNQSVSLARS